MIKTIDEDNINIKGKRVLLRTDFNVPLNKEGKVENNFRIKESLPTINYLIKKGAKVILISHLGDPKGEKLKNLKLNPIKDELENLFNRKVLKADDCIGKEVQEKVKKLKEGEILLLENLRFHNEEKENNPDFAKQLAELGDIYVNDAFSVCHRSHASIIGVPEYLPAFAGFLLEKEIRVLSKVLNNPERPLVVIIGGAKVESKIKVINNFLRKADHVLVGGKIANDILTVKGICIGRIWPEEEAIEEIKKINLTSTVLHLPVDAIISPTMDGDLYVREDAPGKAKSDELILDIGPDTIYIFSRIIGLAKTIVWAGPIGLFEKKAFENGTKAIGEAIIKNTQAFKVAGGGDTIFALDKFNLRNGFNHISTGGGAMLKFLAEDKLPGLEVLNNKN